MITRDDRTTQEPPARQKELTSKATIVYVGIGLVLAVVVLAFGFRSLGTINAGTALATAGIAIVLLTIFSMLTVPDRRMRSPPSDRPASNSSGAQVAPSPLRQAVNVPERPAHPARPTAAQAPDFGRLQSEADQRRVRVKPRVALAVFHPFDGGDIHPVRDVAGIGEQYGPRLESLGIKDTKRLWNADPSFLAGALKVAPETVDEWQSMAELMAIPRIGKLYAELLVRAGVPSIKALCAETPTGLLDRIIRLELRQGFRMRGHTVGIKRVQDWIHAAQEHGPGLPTESTKRPHRIGV